MLLLLFASVAFAEQPCIDVASRQAKLANLGSKFLIKFATLEEVGKTGFDWMSNGWNLISDATGVYIKDSNSWTEEGTQFQIGSHQGLLWIHVEDQYLARSTNIKEWVEVGQKKGKTLIPLQNQIGVGHSKFFKHEDHQLVTLVYEDQLMTPLNTKKTSWIEKYESEDGKTRLGSSLYSRGSEFERETDLKNQLQVCFVLKSSDFESERKHADATKRINEINPIESNVRRNSSDDPKTNQEQNEINPIESNVKRNSSADPKTNQKNNANVPNSARTFPFCLIFLLLLIRN